jgi:hypothetical protein
MGPGGGSDAASWMTCSTSIEHLPRYPEEGGGAGRADVPMPPGRFGVREALAWRRRHSNPWRFGGGGCLVGSAA